MYEIHIESDEFRGKRIVHQHQLVNQVCPKYRPEIEINLNYSKSGARNVYRHVTFYCFELHTVLSAVFQGKVANACF